jgi:RHS repeat-associated protein
MIGVNGGIVWSANYKAFGKAGIETASSLVNNLRFPGQYFDEEAGFYYNLYRSYDPGIGRYFTSDPIGFEGGINLFSYVYNNPTNRIDPIGLLTFKHHGNWGGPGWSAGKYKPEGELTPEDMRVPAINRRDQCYKGHDICLWKCTKDTDKCDDSALSDCIEGCDHKLGNCLLKIRPWHPSFWGTSRGIPINAYTESFHFHTTIPIFVH